ncbi:hypothetical protein BYT27DRAFT_7194901 [Phlegmacium glaucopus]|nr:hypothetical protein BYT27DRAFT_7194901 [Phlegmacium glaucopus]
MPDIPTSDSSASTSPLLLTPESTGASSSQLAIVIDSPSSNASSAATTRKARRQTAFYPNMNSSNKPQKPFSRSAAKRESVMALGSIEHLQHYFTKTGIASKKAPLDKLHYALVPAIGGKEHVPTSPPLDITDFPMPPSPAIPSPPASTFPPHVKTYEVDPESLLPVVIEDVIAVSLAWKLDNITERGRQDQPSLQVPTPDRSLTGLFDVLEVLKTTTRAIRSTRNYLLSLPDESVGASRTQFRSKIFEPRRQPAQPLAASSSTPIAASSSSTTSTSTANTQSSQSDPITLIRRSALEVLTVLRQLEENCRLPLSDDAYDAQSDGGHSRGMGASPSAFASPANITLDLPPDEPDTDLESTNIAGDPDASFSFSLVQVQGRFESVPVWEDDDDGGSAFGFDAEEKTKRDGWDERLVLGSGWLYKQDIKLKELAKERSVVRQYLDVVDEVLFNGKKEDGERGWMRVRREREGKGATSRSAKRRVSTGDSIGRSGGLLDPAGGGDIARRRVSTGMVPMLRGMSLSEEPEDMENIKEGVEDEEEETLDDEGLPEWAQRAAFIDDKMGRAHALLLFFLPSHLQAVLDTSRPTSRTSFLAALSSGQLLCIAYNACVRKSRQPWGFVSKDGIHDILALEREASRNGTGDEEGGKKVWTFRRTDNLRLWVGALKLRYTLPIHIPSQLSGNPSTPLSSPSAKMQSFIFPVKQQPNHRRESPIVFDARMVAKKEEGWEDMLESVLMRWVDRVVEEKRIA